MAILSKTFVSSNIAHGKYDTASSELTIGFANGGLYTYQGVPRDVWDGLVSASSAGSFFHANIRNAGFAYERIG